MLAAMGCMGASDPHGGSPQNVASVREGCNCLAGPFWGEVLPWRCGTSRFVVAQLERVIICVTNGGIDVALFCVRLK